MKKGSKFREKICTKSFKTVKTDFWWKVGPTLGSIILIRVENVIETNQCLSAERGCE